MRAKTSPPPSTGRRLGIGLLIVVACTLLVSGPVTANEPGLQAAPDIVNALACSDEGAYVDTGAIPLHFVPNRDLAGPGVAYYANTLGTAAVLLDERAGVTLHLAELDGLPSRSFEVELAGASRSAAAVGIEATDASASYLIGSDPGRWITGLETYSAIRYKALFPGVDLHYRGNGQQLAATYTLSPGADIRQLRWHIKGSHAADLRLDDAHLMVRLDGPAERSVVWRQPVAWQETDGKRLPVAAAYSLMGTSIGLELGAHDIGRPVFLRVTLAFSPYFDHYAAVRNQDGIVYVTAGSPAVISSSPHGTAHSQDVLVAAIDESSGELSWLTMIGGSGDEIGAGITLGPEGEVLVTGATTSIDLPLLASNQYDLAGPADAFLLRLAPADASLLRSAYLGGPGADAGHDLAVTGDSLWVVGSAGEGLHSLRPESLSFSTFFPSSWTQATSNGTQDSYFISRLDPHSWETIGTALIDERHVERGLEAWTDCQGHQVFFGIRLGLDLSERAAKAIAPCEEPMKRGDQGSSIMKTCEMQYTQDTYATTQTYYSTCDRVNDGWGYHAFCWKARQWSVSYFPPSSGMPTGAVSGADADTLNSLEYSTTIWPDGNPPGSWFGRSSSSAAELAVGAAMAMHRWDVPSYSNLAGAGIEIGIKKVVFDVDSTVGSMSSLCSAQGWSDTTIAEDTAARNCIFDKGGRFILVTVTYDWWDSTFNSGRTDGAITFAQRYTQAEPWVSDPPSQAEADLVLDIARRYRDRVLVAVEPDTIEHHTFVAGRLQREHPYEKSGLTSRADGIALLVRLDDLVY